MSMFRAGWSFRPGRHSMRDASPRSLEDESFDTSSANLPVYLSRHEAGEWMVPFDENGQPVEIMDDTIDYDGAGATGGDNHDDDKFSDIASSVVSSTTATESRQFWLNCLKENGVDMAASPRRAIPPSTVPNASPLSGGGRSPKLLTLYDHNVRRNSAAAENDALSLASFDTGKRSNPSSTSSGTSVNILWEKKSSSEAVRRTPRDVVKPFGESSPRENNQFSPRQSSSYHLPAGYTSSVAEPHRFPIQEPLLDGSCYTTDTSFGNNEADAQLTNDNDDGPGDRSFTLDDHDAYPKAQDTSLRSEETDYARRLYEVSIAKADDSFLGPPASNTEYDRSIENNKSKIQVTTVTSKDSDDSSPYKSSGGVPSLAGKTSISLDREQDDFQHSKSRIQVTTVTSQESEDGSLYVPSNVPYGKTIESNRDSTCVPGKSTSSRVEAPTTASQTRDHTSVPQSKNEVLHKYSKSSVAPIKYSNCISSKSRIQVTMVASQESDESSWSEFDLQMPGNDVRGSVSYDDSLASLPKQPHITKVSATTEQSHNTDVTAGSSTLGVNTGKLPEHPTGVEDLLSASLDHSVFIDDDSMERKYEPKITNVEIPKEKTISVKSTSASHALSKHENQGDKYSPSPNVPKAITTNNTDKHQEESAQIEFDPNDQESWMYWVWHRKGLMKKLHPKCTRHYKEYCREMSIRTATEPGHVPLRVKTGSNSAHTPRGRDSEEVQSSEEPLVTPRDAFITLDYKGVRANDEDAAKNQHRSLPAHARVSAQKEGGRKSFDNIMKMWRNKSDDRPNSFFSPEHYMAQEVRERADNPPKSRPTQHSQLMSIAERTAMFDSKNASNPRPSQKDQNNLPASIGTSSGQKATPRSTTSIDSGKEQAAVSASKTPPYPLFSPAPRDLSIDEQLQRPPARLSSGKRRQSQPSIPPSRSSEKRKGSTQRRETINPKEHFRRHAAPGRSHSDYKSVIKNDYRSVVKSFLASVEEHKELGEAKRDEIPSSLSGIDTIPQESNAELSDLEQAEYDLTTPRSNDSASIPLSAQQSASKDSPWTQEMMRQLKEVPQGSAGKESPYGQERPWRQDLVRRRVSNFSDCSVGAMEEGPCQCSTSVFSGNDELIDFFLPRMGMACNCGKRPLGLHSPEEPTALENILRPWQVRFLAAFGIHRGDQLVKAHHRSARALANALRQYRRKHGMTPFRTKSCAMALQIWSKTSKAYVRSIRKQLTSGTSNLKVPNTLYIISSFLEKMHEMHSPMPRNPNMVHEDEASV